MSNYHQNYSHGNGDQDQYNGAGNNLTSEEEERYYNNEEHLDTNYYNYSGAATNHNYGQQYGANEPPYSAANTGMAEDRSKSRIPSRRPPIPQNTLEGQSYENFLNSHPDNHIQTPQQAYTDVFVNNNQPTSSYQVLPEINIIQNTPNLLNQTNNAQPTYFNDTEYYFNNDHSGNNLISSNNSNNYSASILSNEEDTRPILNQNNIPLQSQGYVYDNDIERIYVDQNGDDYEINSYLGNHGEMVDPYNPNLEPLEEEFLIDHKDLGEYDITNERSFVSSSSSTSMEDGYDEEDKNRGLKRAGTEVRKFKLWRGNFVFDSPISKSLLHSYSTGVANEDILTNEFKFMRYQAVTCEPNEMAIRNFTVRQLKYLRPRETELMIVITMYNEDHILLGRTLKGVMDNIRYMIRKSNSTHWGPDAWKKIVVCVVSDGRAKINEKALALMSSLGCYQDGFAKDEINSEQVKMHLYEHTTMMNITDVTAEGLTLSCDQTTVPIQLLFALKEQNQKKINSHRWAFEGFAELLQPNIVTLLDAGTMPGKDSIYELWKEFKDPNVGGACGEIKADIGKMGSKLLNPLVASQNFEYKMSNILDKTGESNFGFITVLPGAFSAYRFVAVRGEPLKKYFYGETLENEGLKFFSSNMYLAEDRILCFEIVTKRDAKWLLRYSRSSSASTDVPERVPEFILQRRRWLNGSFFASVYSFCHFYRIWTSGHSLGRKILLNIEFAYLFFNTLMSWFSLSSFFLIFRILTLSIAVSYGQVFQVLSVIFFWLYGFSVFTTFILSLGNKPKSTEKYYVMTFIFFAILMVYLIFCSIFMIVKTFQDVLKDRNVTFKGLFSEETFADMLISVLSTYGLYIASSIICLQPWHMLTSFAQYLLLSPSYINILNIYAFCNVHDISWGTKGAVSKKPLGKINTKEDGTFKMEVLISSEEIQSNYSKYMNILQSKDASVEDGGNNNGGALTEEQKTGYYANVRSLVIIFWVLTNFAIVAAVLESGGISDYIAMRAATKVTDDVSSEEIMKPILTSRATVYFSVILWLVALSALLRFIGCIVYMIKRLLRRVTNF
ncbi:hypothetical protein KAFR_0A07650 [Kazachstania africana CBS 2517]|uniref:chitin synthase n=1 Tax=Kazachstania africana (strain ATCC 22294 / BCRC 22015 / CBS 2517 / CECT 1963 / NBRC 1671 / NRRL Y-8276) TaxID=1071382 RepID=H2AP99_KAZAF|nr:hypothetical protein KAFR_0A07650 [Kazachstania africana CBS 2517]CCF56199.1 hypothetical protein KAFR_0A07650 [Kazachstania africana CBS 2517]